MNDDQSGFATIDELGQRYRTGELTPVAVVEHMLARIDALNPTLNAFITVTAERAMAAAKEAAAALQAGHDRGPLHGIPIALKDLIDTAGIRTTAGARILADNIPTKNALLVDHLLNCGALLIGKTNLLEFAYGIVHPDYGPTWNPWDPTRTAGGSSGGSAAAVTAGLCAAAVGTDTGGSIRIPAAYCGVVGLKPTYGLVSLEGVFPLSWSLDHAGPLARTCQDAAYLLNALCGRPLQPLPAVELTTVRFGILTEHLEGAEMQPAVRAAFEELCTRLRAAGATLQPVAIPHLALADGALLTVIAPEASAIHARWIKERPDDYAPLTRQQIELGFVIPGVAQVRAQQFRRYLTTQFLQVLEQMDVILSPTAPWVAPHEDPAVVGDEGAAEARRTGPYNLTGLPALTLNCGFSAEGLPIGVQLAGRPYTDDALLAIGAAIEGLLPEFTGRHPD
ncbi:MAG: amidase [Caldilineaceae bacterium]